MMKKKSNSAQLVVVVAAIPADGRKKIIKDDHLEVATTEMLSTTLRTSFTPSDSRTGTAAPKMPLIQESEESLVSGK